jgi:hypothetical protein
VNVVDGQTGVVKKTLQISNITEGKITFRSSPLRSSVLGRTISGSFTADEIGLDDYLSYVGGICVPYYGKPTVNFLIQFAVGQLRGQRLGGGNASEEQVLLDTFEKQVERTWVGREHQMRIQKRSSQWGIPARRWFWE